MLAAAKAQSIRLSLQPSEYLHCHCKLIMKQNNMRIYDYHSFGVNLPVTTSISSPPILVIVGGGGGKA
jgi:hypothetical protein